MTTINFDAAIKDIKGQPIIEREKDKDGKEIEHPVTLGVIVASAMIANMPDDTRLDATKKVQMFRLALKAQEGGRPDLTVEELSAIKDRIGKTHGTLIVGRVFDLIEGPEKAAKAEKVDKPKSVKPDRGG